MAESNHKLKVLIADDHQLLRDGLRMLLVETEGYQVIAEAYDTCSLEHEARMHMPDIVISDYNMPDDDMITVLRNLKAFRPSMKIIVLTGVISGTLYKTLLGIPVNGILLKEGSMDDILKGLEKVSKNEIYLSEIVKEHIARLDLLLTKRELEIVALVAKGASNKEISSNLFISPKTVDNHRSNIFRKLSVNSAVELAEYARKNGLLIDQ